jgi:hypothetical protein
MNAAQASMPADALHSVFQMLGGSGVGNLTCVSKSWQTLTEEEDAWDRVLETTPISSPMSTSSQASPPRTPGSASSMSPTALQLSPAVGTPRSEGGPPKLERMLSSEKKKQSDSGKKLFIAHHCQLNSICRCCYKPNPGFVDENLSPCEQPNVCLFKWFSAPDKDPAGGVNGSGSPPSPPPSTPSRSPLGTASNGGSFALNSSPLALGNGNGNGPLGRAVSPHQRSLMAFGFRMDGPEQSPTQL